MADYLAGPDEHCREGYLDCYRSDEDPADAAATLAGAIDHWFCGPFDDGDEGQEYILTRTLERAATFIAAQPCACGVDLCPRCMAIGCDYDAHRTPGCRPPSTEDAPARPGGTTGAS